ncbi:histone deacetylase family protein [Neisseria meningitidis]|nr:histone deacetylase family protein [Neisseria meningitidis]EOB87810.1 histone deacetylase domain protein [Neisseria meningitidis NM604]AOA45740.1 deacetylase [Neisseria meningitidis]AOA47861.1 deacetylase [Neisseria meningitidis]AOT28402.1 deacetylase [Neisseria meningitidis]ARC06641.1 deacetylase [Neisseria meningitidis]
MSLTRLILKFYALLRLFLGKNARTAWISHPACAGHEPGANHPDSPDRILCIEQALRRAGIWQHLQTIEAEEISDTRLALVHSSKYLNRLESCQPQKGKIFRLNDDTAISTGSLSAARFAAGSAVQAVDMVMNRKAWHAFCAARPPGHHAGSGKAGGFCLLNNVAAGVMHAIAEYRLKRIAVIDFDVHYGDGTAEIFKDDPRILFFNLFETDLFPFPENNDMPDGGNMVHLPLPPGTGSRTFREAVRRQWLPRLAAFKPELVLLSAGFDAHRLDESGRLNLHEADFAWLTHKIIQTASGCPGKIVSVLEGGYTLEPLAQSAAEHIRVLAGLGKSDAATAYQKTLDPTKKRFAKPKTGQVRQPTQSDRYDI